MSPQEQQARTVLLARALETADPPARLVSGVQRDQAGKAAWQASRLQASAGDRPLTAAELIGVRAEALVQSASAVYPGLAQLHRPRPVWRWLGIAVPLLALLSGIATDRIANPHRVDLLSAPLLAVIFWNVLMYALLLGSCLRSLRRRQTVDAQAPETDHLPTPSGTQTHAPVLSALHHWLSALPLRHSAASAWRDRRGALPVVAALFYRHWHGLTDALTMYRFKAVLHVSAAAWGAGIALSLIGRGLVVEYQVGWESTFLQAQQVQAILATLFWPLTAFMTAPPFTIDEVAALRNFAVPGANGARWVGLYAGLLALVVVLPRLLLAAWAAWRARLAARSLRIDLDEPYYRDLALSLQPVRLAVGLVTGDALTAAQLLRLLRQCADDPVAPQLVLTSAEGDQLRWIEEPVVTVPVDVVLKLTTDLQWLAAPAAWDARPQAVQSIEQLGRSWLQMPLLLDTLERSLPAAASPGIKRLRQQWGQDHVLCARQSVLAIATYLLKVSPQLNGAANAASTIETQSPAIDIFAQARDELLLRLFELYRLDSQSARGLEQKLAQAYLPATIQAIGKQKAGAAGAAAGATVGGALDLALAGMSLGAASALGAMLGAGIGVAVASWKKKGLPADTLMSLLEAALLLYLEVANACRVQAGTGDAQGARDAWTKAIAGAVSSQKKSLGQVWDSAACSVGGNGPAASGDTAAAQAELVRLLSSIVQTVLNELYPAAGSPST